MKAGVRVRGRKAVLLAVVAAAAVAAVPAFAATMGDAKSEHWGVITRNTIGSPVAMLRDGPYGSFGHTGPGSEPPFGKGSLGLEVNGSPNVSGGAVEKTDFGNEVDFLGDPVLGITDIGFQVFQTGENVSINARNMPNIRLEIDANLNSLPADNYTTMVWVPDPAPAASTDEWSPYIDATTTGNWYFTGAEAAATGCTQALNCNFAQAMTALNDGGDAPIIYTVAVGKGRDNAWVGAIDGFRINKKVYDFEADGVKVRDAKK